MLKKTSILLTEDKFAEQEDYIQKIKKLNVLFETEHRRPRYAFTQTYGCQQNESDTEKINGMLIKMGFVLVSEKNEADLILLNTCAVREHAEQKVFGTVGALVHLKKKNPSLIIAMCGCMVSQQHIRQQIRQKYKHVTFVFDTSAIWRFPENLYNVFMGKDMLVDAGHDDGIVIEDIPVKRLSKYKAWVPIMTGCNNFCSYCIVPYVRGREKSRKREDVLNEIEALVLSGYKEIVLLGQNVNSYHKDIDDSYDFADLLKDINRIEGDFIVRFMTSHPKDASHKLFDIMAECHKIERHIHLPFQSGSDDILKSMNRKYTSGEYLALVEYARKKVPGITFTSDVIVGFPGESDDDFEKTLDLIRKVGFCGLYMFIYSKRKGTPAAKMENQVSDDDKKHRFMRLTELQRQVSEEFHRQFVGKSVRILSEGFVKNDHNMISGRTEENIIVHAELSDRSVSEGEFVFVEITDSMNWALKGKIKD